MMANFISIGILIMPWLIILSNYAPEPATVIKGAFFDFIMLGIICIGIKNGVKSFYGNPYLAYLCAWIFLTFFFNWYYPIFTGKGYHIGFMEPMIHITLASIATIIVCSNFGSLDFIKCAKAMCLSATLVSIFCIFQGIGLDPLEPFVTYTYKESRHITALLGNPDIVGNYLSLCLPFFLFFSRKKYYIGLGLCVLALLMVKSSLSILAAIAGVSFFLFQFSKFRKIVISALVLMAIIFLMTPSLNKFNTQFTGRGNAWKMIIGKLNNPIFGQGLGIVKELNIVTGVTGRHEETKDWWLSAHNDYLEIYASLGCLGLGLFLLTVFHAMSGFNKVSLPFYSSSVSFLVLMFGSFPMEMPPIALNGLVCYWALCKK